MLFRSHLVEVLGDAWGLDGVSLGILLHELIYLLAISLVLDETLGILECIYQDVDLLVELA